MHNRTDAAQQTAAIAESDRHRSPRAARGHSNRDRAERDNRTKDEFLATLAHELRNPLGAISNAVRVLELTQAEGEPARHAHEAITRQIGHISHLVNELLDVERVASGKIRLNRQPLDRPRRYAGRSAPSPGMPS